MLCNTPNQSWNTVHESVDLRGVFLEMLAGYPLLYAGQCARPREGPLWRSTYRASLCRPTRLRAQHPHFVSLPVKYLSVRKREKKFEHLLYEAVASAKLVCRAASARTQFAGRNQRGNKRDYGEMAGAPCSASIKWRRQ
jgi:hypothetical protein